MLLSFVALPTTTAAFMQTAPTCVFKTPIGSPQTGRDFMKLLAQFDPKANTASFEEILESIGPTPSVLDEVIDVNYANDWEEYLAKEAFSRHCNGEFATEASLDDNQSIPSVSETIDSLITTASTVTIESLPLNMTVEFEQALCDLPRNQVYLCPTAKASVPVEAIPNLRHLV